MAKSLFEPKKVPTYAENIIKPGTGLKAAPVPVRQQSATRTVPKTQSIPLAAAVVSAPAPVPTPPPAPAPTPAPPAPEPETRAFSFDGNTELTASCGTAFGRKALAYGTIGVTLTPYWSSAETGSFAIFSMTKDGASENEGFTIFIKRTAAGSSFGFEYISGSTLTGNTVEGTTLTDIYSGPVSEQHYQIAYGYGTTGRIKEGKSYIRNGRYVYNPDYPTVQAAQGQVRNHIHNTVVGSEGYSFSIGGPSTATHINASTINKFSGSISNLMVVTQGSYYLGSPVSEGHYNDSQVKVAYKFEGNVSASKSSMHLDVVGTETYVSSSI